MPYELPKLKYNFNELEPAIDATTMEIHYSKHHQAYINNLNIALEKAPELSNLEVNELLKRISDVPSEIRQAVINNAGGHSNHMFFWEILTPNSSREPVGGLSTKINEIWGNFDTFKEVFAKSALTRFGSGWAWLVKTGDDNLEVYSTANQDSPIMEGKTPILGLDVWEHAYYLNYQNRRADYIQSWWSVVDWEAADQNFQKA